MWARTHLPFRLQKLNLIELGERWYHADSTPEQRQSLQLYGVPGTAFRFTKKVERTSRQDSLGDLPKGKDIHTFKNAGEAEMGLGELDAVHHPSPHFARTPAYPMFLVFLLYGTPLSISCSSSCLCRPRMIRS